MRGTRNARSDRAKNTTSVARVAAVSAAHIVHGADGCGWWLAMTATGSGKDDKEVGLAAAILAARHAQYETDPSAATGYLERALELDPTNSDLLRDSYFIAAQAGDFAVAVPSAKRFMSVTQSQRSSAPPQSVARPSWEPLTGDGARTVAAGLAIRQDGRR